MFILYTENCAIVMFDFRYCPCKCKFVNLFCKFEPDDSVKDYLPDDTIKHYLIVLLT